MTQSIESKDAEIKQLKEEVDRLKEIIESDNEKKDGRLCTLKCGVCLDIKKATEVCFACLFFLTSLVPCKFSLWTLFLQDVQRLLEGKSRQQMPQMSSEGSQADRHFRLTSALHIFTFVFLIFFISHGQSVLFSIEANP